MSVIEVEFTAPVGTPATVEVGRDGNGRFVSTSGAKAVVEVDQTPRESTIPEAVRERIAALRDRQGDKPKEPEPTHLADPPAVPVDAAPADDAESAPEETAEAPAPDAWESERAELQGVTQRQRDVITQLKAELAETRKSSESEMARRARLIEEAEDTYVREPTKAIRKVLAAVLRVEPDSEKVKDELHDLFIDLTSELSGVASDSAHQAKRVSALTRLEWDLKDKRRAAGEKTQAPPVDEKSTAVETAVPIVKELFASRSSKYPYLAAAADLDGVTPEVVIAGLLVRGFETGDFDRAEKDEILVEKAARLADTHYKPRLEKIWARKPSTATPGVTPAPKQADKPAAVSSKTIGARENGRSLSNADASVAPAATPPPKKDEKPAFRSEAERQRWATRHLRGES